MEEGSGYAGTVPEVWRCKLDEAFILAGHRLRSPVWRKERENPSLVDLKALPHTLPSVLYHFRSHNPLEETEVGLPIGFLTFGGERIGGYGSERWNDDWSLDGGEWVREDIPRSLERRIARGGVSGETTPSRLMSLKPWESCKKVWGENRMPSLFLGSSATDSSS